MKTPFRFFITTLFLFSILFLSGCQNTSESEKMIAEGNTKFENADFAGAEKIFSEAIKKYPDNLKAYFKLASARVCANPSISFFDELMENMKEKPYPGTLLLYPVIFQTSRYAEAMITYKERKKKLLEISDEIFAFIAAINKNPNNAKLYRGRGEWHFLLGDIREAINDFTKAIQLDNNFDMAFLMRARCYSRGYINNAEHNYVDFYEREIKNKYNIRRAYQINPKNIMVQTELYTIYRNDKVSQEEELKLLSKMVSSDTTNWIALLNRALLRIDMKNDKGALQDFERLVKKFPDDSWHRNRLGSHKLKMGMIKEGINDLRKAQALSTYPQQIKWIQKEIDKYSKTKK